MSRRRMIALNLIMTFLHVVCINARSTYSQSNSQNYPLPIYPIEQQAPLTEQQQQQQHQYSFQRNGNSFNYQNSFPYQTFLAENRRNNFDFIQPERGTATERATGTSYVQQQLISPDGQLEQQRSALWMGRPIVPDYASKQYFPSTNTRLQSIRNVEYNPEIPHTDNDNIYYHPNRVNSPRSLSQSSLLIPFQTNSYRSSPAVDYATHFERYLSKYPKRLRPTFNGNGFRE